MDNIQLFIIFLFFAFVVLSIGIIVIWLTRKHLFIEYENAYEENIKQKIIKKLKDNNYSFKVKGKKIHVESSRFKALNFHLKQTNSNVKVYREVSESSSGVILMIIGIFLFGGPALFLSQLSVVKSKELGNELYPLLQEIK
jgi:energy-converting hydrogenase Eha subunit H